MQSNRFRRFFLNPHPAAIAVLSAVILSTGCGRRFQGIDSPRAQLYQLTVGEVSTGDTKRIEIDNGTKSLMVAYTPAGAVNEFSQIQKDVAATSDKLTAKAIQSVEIAMFDSKATRTESHPVRLTMDIVFDSKSTVSPKALNFDVPLTLSGNALTGHVESATTAKMDVTFSTDITCLDLNCADIDIRLHRHVREKSGALSASLADVGILYRLTHPTVHVQKAKDLAASNDPDLANLSAIKGDQPAIRSSVAIVDGHSYSHLVVPEPNTKPEEKKNTLDIRTDMVDTQETASQVETLQIGSNQKSIPAELVGADPDTGNMVIDIKSGARLYINEVNPDSQEKKTPPKVDVPIIHVRADASRLIPFEVDEKKWPRTFKVTTGFAAHANDDEVQRLVRVWLGQEKDRTTCGAEADSQKLQALLTYGPQALQLATPIAQKLDVTPEIAYILALESSYVIDPRRPTTELAGSSDPNVKTSALGPWQIVDMTAMSIRDSSKIKFNVFPVVNHVFNPLDDRTFFYNSTYMASLLLKGLFDQFQTDPAIAIMAYNGGNGYASSSIKRTAKYEEFDITLEEIAKHRMQTKTNCAYLNYAYTFLALRTIGQNLDYYQIKPKPIENKNYLKRLKNPDSPLPPGI